MVTCGDGVYLKKCIDNEQLHQLAEFEEKISELIELGIVEAEIYGIDEEPLVVMEMAAVLHLKYYFNIPFQEFVVFSMVEQ